MRIATCDGIGGYRRAYAAVIAAIGLCLHGCICRTRHVVTCAELRGAVSGWNWNLPTTSGADNIHVFNRNDLDRSLITDAGYLVNSVPCRTPAGIFADSESTNTLDIGRETDREPAPAASVSPQTIGPAGPFLVERRWIGRRDFARFASA